MKMRELVRARLAALHSEREEATPDRQQPALQRIVDFAKNDPERRPPTTGAQLRHRCVGTGPTCEACGGGRRNAIHV